MLLAVLSGYFIAILAPFLHRYTREHTGWVIALLPVGIFVYLARFIPLLATGETFQVSYLWIEYLGVSLDFNLDGLGLIFALVITGIGALVSIYGGGYLKGHPQLGRFYAFLMIFMASMLGVVLADNLAAVFIFWELTSISSYLLIGFEHEREEARNAALQALLITGGGGLALLAGLVIMGQVGGTWQISALNALEGQLRDHPLYLSMLLLVLVGAFTKSAQAPFHFWLPGAMEAPTPVSAYLHSATMVKAGVYLLARLSPSLGDTPAWFYLVGGTGLATAIIGAYLALSHSNMKRILAYTTISSLGIMTMLIGVGSSTAIKAAIVYLLAHALYKGALFMIAGALYHETGTQDVDELGGLRHKMPVLMWVTILAAISLAGFGPLLSFIGKELLLEAVLETHGFDLLLAAAVVLAAAASVAAALILTVRPYFGDLRATPHMPHDPLLPLWLGPVLLGSLGLVFGLYPAAIAAPIIAPAAAAVLGKPLTVKLVLWHGVNPALILSVASFFLGWLLFRLWNPFRRWAAALAGWLPWGPARGYKALLDELIRFAGALTRIMQSGHLHDYLMIVTATTVALIGFTFWSQGGNYQPPTWTPVRFYEVILAFVILAAALVVTLSSSRLLAIAALGVVGSGISLIFVLFGAPDLAMTQILIETVTVILLVLILYHLPKFSQLTGRAARTRDAFIALTAGALMTALVLIANGADHFLPISSYYLNNSVLLGHGRNIVNVILVDFRGLDTLGEITVLSLAGIGVFALLKQRQRS